MARIFLRHLDGVIEGLDCAPGVAPNKVILTTPPRMPLVVVGASYVPPTFEIVKDADANSPYKTGSFLVAEKDPIDDTFTTRIKALNYDPRYYDNDTDVPPEEVRATNSGSGTGGLYGGWGVPPTITGIDPDPPTGFRGSLNTYTIHGTGFTETTRVEVGTGSATFTVISATQLQIRSRAFGKVTVVTPTGAVTSTWSIIAEAPSNL